MQDLTQSPTEYINVSHKRQETESFPTDGLSRDRSPSPGLKQLLLRQRKYTTDAVTKPQSIKLYDGETIRQLYFHLRKSHKRLSVCKPNFSVHSDF